jgi:hypothetical protein
MKLSERCGHAEEEDVGIRAVVRGSYAAIGRYDQRANLASSVIITGGVGGKAYKIGASGVTVR